MFIFNKEKRNYKKILTDSLFSIQKEISLIPEKEIKEFLEITLDTSERILRGILFIKNPFDFNKNLGREDLFFWFEKVSLCLIAHSYYCVEIVKKFYNLQIIYLGKKSSTSWFDEVYSYYNHIFNKQISQLDIDSFTLGYKEDIEKGYSQKEDKTRVNEMIKKDFKIVSSILLENIWQEKFENNENKGYFLGGQILEAHKQLVRPFLENLANKSIQNKTAS